MTGFDIGNRHVGDGAPCLIVGEVAQAHEGSLALAHVYVDAIADAGADAVKFQCHLAEHESTPDEPWRVEPEYPQDASRYAYWQRTAFTPEQWKGLKEHADRRGLLFLCSPFSVAAVKLLDPLVPAWKVASGEVTNAPMLAAIRATGKPAIVSCGMADGMDVYAAIEAVGGRNYALLHCVSMYPTPAHFVGLRAMASLGRRVSLFMSPPLGLSDHSGTIWPAIGAVTLGASIVEVHVKLSTHERLFDSASSITPEQLKQLVEGVRFIEKAKQPVDKDALARELAPMRALFMDRHKRRAALA